MLLFGSLFAIFERSDYRGSVFGSRYFWHGVVFTTIFNLAVAYAIFKFPDWMWMYYREDARNTFAELVYIFFFLYYLPYALGFYLGFDAKNRSFALWAGLLILFAAAEAWIVWKLFDRYSVIGTREEFLNGTAVSLFGPQNPIGLVMNGSVGLMIVYYAAVVMWYRKSKRNRLN